MVDPTIILIPKKENPTSANIFALELNSGNSLNSDTKAKSIKKLNNIKIIAMNIPVTLVRVII